MKIQMKVSFTIFKNRIKFMNVETDRPTYIQGNTTNLNVSFSMKFFKTLLRWDLN